MSMPARREYRSPLTDMIDWIESPWTFLHSGAGRPMRVEDFVRDGSYVVRAELPGIDPDRDLEVTVGNGVLTITAERRAEHDDRHRSEFHYGSFTRSVNLPPGADSEHVGALYGHGILEVTVRLELQDSARAARKVPVRQNQHIPAS